MTTSAVSTRIERSINRETVLAHLAFVLLFALAVYLRVNNLAWNPGWYSDEGSDLNIARNLAEGRLQYFALGGTPLVAARVPFFHFALVGAFSLWGYDVLAARLVAAIAGVATIILLYYAARQMLNERLALLAAFGLTIMPNALLYDRIGLAYNLQAFFFVLGWWTLWRFSSDRHVRWLVVAALAAGAAYMTALTGLALVVAGALIVFWYDARRVAWALGLMLLPGALYLGALFLLAPDALLQDLALIVSRTGDSVSGQIFNLITNYSFWLDWTVWIGIGIAGLFLLEDRRARGITLIVFFVTLINAMRILPGDASAHRYLGLLPFIALGSANFVLRARRFLSAQLQNDVRELIARLPYWSRLDRPVNAAVSIVVGGLLFAPLIWMGAWDYYLVSSREAPRSTRLDALLATKPHDAIAVTDFVNTHAQSTDVVLASPTIAWRIQARAADFEQMLAFEGVATENYGAGLPRARFVFQASLENATYVIVDNLWRGWGSQRMPALRDYIRTIETWPRVLQRGEYSVYRNPAR
ncbi:MAG: glycosyltransferase family 39 protein [Chloroflexi bacterium]|nr:glycosyltransferase family 39 protein [Chloroflexota bacterium]